MDTMHIDLLIRIAAGAALGGVIGYERDRHGRQVGLRTHLLVAMAAATFMIISVKFVYFQHYRKEDLVAVDPSRIAASIVAGIGFLAGGSILRTGTTVQGITTAAGLWLVTAIGMCSGAAMYVEAVVVTLLGVLALTALRRFEDKDDRSTRRRIALVLGEESAGVADIMKALEALGAVVSDMDYERRLDDKRRVNVTLDARIPNTIGVETLIDQLAKQPGVRRVHVQAPT
ncbi:MgtC/SapB family protein [Sorangium sp. So ce315]|uniref:MgtC/SapB family protein n=1 Tax=Sorangium sp. So ce315 TaxID=3133299 RepID=UPI003F633D41